MIVFLLLAALCCFAYRLMVRRRDFLTTCEVLVDRLPRDLYESLAGFVERDADFDDRVFWQDSRRLSGIADRLRTAAILRRLVQAHYFAGRITKEQARRVWRVLCLQIWFSVIAIPEAVVCYAVDDCPHIAALTALRFYGDVVIRSSNLFDSADAPECMLRVPDLL